MSNAVVPKKNTTPFTNVSCFNTNKMWHQAERYTSSAERFILLSRM